MGIFLKEHIAHTLKLTDDFNLVNTQKIEYLYNHLIEEIRPRKFKTERGKDYYCFNCKISEKEVVLQSDYFVGIDWLTKDRFIHVEPKLNIEILKSFETIAAVDDDDISEEDIRNYEKEAAKNAKNEIVQEVDIIAMLLEIMSHTEIAKYTDKLLLIDWEATEIPITQRQDLLTPFLVVKFLKLLQDIVRKGLKKSYYKITENLNNRIKGKILIGQQIKQNIFKNRLTNTVCEYQVFGEDSVENRFLKRVYLFCTKYVENNVNFFKDKNNISWIINYIRPTFEKISSEVDQHEIKYLKYNPFFKEYKEAIKIGQHILKRFSYNITKATEEQISTPPFWIDMPKMFELYVFAGFLKDNSNLTANNFNYQFSTHGNSLDFLVCDESSEKKVKIVVDTKYKLRYNYGQIHNDIRQVAGYARLNKVKEKGPKIEKEIPCLIIYPKLDKEPEVSLNVGDLLNNEINAYHEVYKLGINLPLIS
ncbi:McrC family protein [Pedobacter montanisoli]|uniref:McrC family protein n=1 Tax=Pedobacter montanisoli TaxID=2923277 RepID=A0ABS9ZS42_9SPHI|nr:McrC family protein [Pedobacter montanisoli]MCJ0741391.1 McrC family protein [Pedobacter montanisoli]